MSKLGTTMAAAALAMIGADPASAATIPVTPGQSIQAAIAAAVAGDTIAVAAGTYEEDIDFLGKAVTVLGEGPVTVLRGTGTGPVVTFAAGEGGGATLDSVLVRGGSAPAGAGVLIDDASPTIVRNVILDNEAVSAGSGIYVVGAGAQPVIANNLVIYNRNSGGDPHAIQTNGSSPTIVNNTIAGNDSNGIFLAGGGIAVVLNNVLTRNGSRGSADEPRRGRGICNFNSSSVIRYNLFYRNARSALLQGGNDFRRIRRAQRVMGSAQLEGNIDGHPKFVRRRIGKEPSSFDPMDFELRANSKAVAAGDPDPAFDDLGGGRNTIGHLGGPLAAMP